MNPPVICLPFGGMWKGQHTTGMNFMQYQLFCHQVFLNEAKTWVAKGQAVDKEWAYEKILGQKKTPKPSSIEDLEWATN